MRRSRNLIELAIVLLQIAAVALEVQLLRWEYMRLWRRLGRLRLKAIEERGTEKARLLRGEGTA